MLLYLLMIVVSCAALYIAERMCAQRTDGQRGGINEDVYALGGLPGGEKEHGHGNALRFAMYSVALLFPLIVAVIRHEVGPDWVHYVNLLYLFHSGQGSTMEFGFVAAVYLLGLVSQNLQLVIAFTSLVTMLLVFFTVKRHSAYPALSYFIFFSLGFYFHAFVLIRQYLAVVICFWAWRFVKKNNNLAFVGFVLLAMSMHRSAFIMLIFFLFLGAKYKFSHYAMILAAGVAIALVHERFLDLMLAIPAFAPYAEWYIHLVGAAAADHVSWFNLLLSLAVTVGCFAYYREMTSKPGNVMLVNAAVFSFILYATASYWMGWKLTRIALYLNIFHVLTIPEIIACERNPNVRKLYAACVVLAFTVTFFMLLRANTGAIHYWLPYRTVFGNLF